jgi:transcription initiation factor IIE alpha subunit
METFERLVATVARAFYDDNTVVILDSLMRERFIRDEEFGPRLKLCSKDVRAILSQLENERMVSYEDLTMDDKRTSRCWYIDYKRFYLLVRYRMFLMTKEIQDREKLQFNRLFFVCPTCGEKYPELQAMRLVNKFAEFVCPHCCPHTNFKDVPSEPYFKLKEYDNRAELSELDSIVTKIKDQLHETPLHDGIFDLLDQLKETPLSRNKPSENIKIGLTGTKIEDTDTLKEIEENSNRFRGKARSSAVGSVQKYLAEGGNQVSVEIVTSTDPSEEDRLSSSEPAFKRIKGMPEHLQGSRVTLTSLASVPSVPTATPTEAVPSAVSPSEVTAAADNIEWEDGE